jgi:2'-5' RNA ligase
MILRYDRNDPGTNKNSELALVIMLPDYLDRVISSVREQFDPDFHIIKSHITLVFPFISTRLIEDISSPIASVIQRFPPFRVELSSIGDFYPDSPIIYWAVKKHPVIDELYKSLYTELDLAIPHRQYCPHVTVAREISNHRLVMAKEKIVIHLPDADFTVQEIDLITPASDHSWTSVRTFPLNPERLSTK